MGDKIDMSISGSSTMPGGEYGRVRIGGDCRIDRVEYSERLDAQPGTVDSAVHTGEEA